MFFYKLVEFGKTTDLAEFGQNSGEFAEFGQIQERGFS
jgi:hypothetical protein